MICAGEVEQITSSKASCGVGMSGLRLAILSKASKLNLTGYGLDPRPQKPILAMKTKVPRLVDAGM